MRLGTLDKKGIQTQGLQFHALHTCKVNLVGHNGSALCPFLRMTVNCPSTLNRQSDISSTICIIGSSTFKFGRPEFDARS